MDSINWIEDYGIPAGVGVINLLMRAWDDNRKRTAPEGTQIMEFEPLAPLVIAGVGTVGRVAGVMSDYDEHMKMAVAASMPRVVTGLYDWATKAPAEGTQRRLSNQRVVPAGAPARSIANRNVAGSPDMWGKEFNRGGI